MRRQSEHRRGRRALAAAVVFITVGSLHAAPSLAEEVVRSAPVGLAAAPDLEVRDGQLLLSLEEAIIAAMRRNLGLQVQRYRREQAFTGIMGAQGIFDLNLSARRSPLRGDEPCRVRARRSGHSELRRAVVRTSNWTSCSRPAASPASPGTTRSSRPTRSSRRSTPATTSAPISSSTSRCSAVSARLVTKRGIYIARNNSLISLEALEQRVIATVLDVEGAYWDVVEGQEQLKVSLESLELAKELHEMNTHPGRRRHDGATRAGAERGRRRHPRGRGAARRDAGPGRRRSLAPAPQPRGLRGVDHADPAHHRSRDGPHHGQRRRGDRRGDGRAQRAAGAESRARQPRDRPARVPPTWSGLASICSSATASTASAATSTSAAAAASSIRGRRRSFPAATPMPSIRSSDADFEGWSAGLVFGYPVQNRDGPRQSNDRRPRGRGGAHRARRPEARHPHRGAPHRARGRWPPPRRSTWRRSRPISPRRTSTPSRSATRTVSRPASRCSRSRRT